MESKNFASNILGQTVTNDGTIYVTGGNNNYPGIQQGFVYSSTDRGTSWVASIGAIDEDSYSLVVDPCDPQKIYVANENFAWPGDSLSKLYCTIDGGQTWKVGFSHPTNYLSGSVSESADALYAQTIYDGVLRSTDQGVQWVNIGGPGQHYDSRDVSAINDNIIFAMDSSGSIWETFNSGGDSVRGSGSSTPTLTVSPMILFSSDTIWCDSLTKPVLFSKSGCPIPSISSWSIVGDDSASFKVDGFSQDSILVTLSGTKLGNQNAQLILTLDNGTTEIVTLGGYVTRTLRLTTEDVQTDTLGATVAVPIPITIKGFERPADVELVLHYDGTVDYLGSFSPTGVKLDVAGEQWAGRSLLHIAGAAPGAVAGYAKFNVFNDSGEDAHATFDSMSVLTAVSPCQYSLPEAVTSTISPPSGCGAVILSQFFHLGVFPHFSVNPNPANGNVWLTCSVDVGDATIEIYDMLGAERIATTIALSKNNPVELPLPQADGVYNIVVRYSGGRGMVRVVRQRN